MSDCGASARATCSVLSLPVPNRPPRPPKVPAPPIATAITAAQPTIPRPPASRAADPAQSARTPRMVRILVRRGTKLRDRWRQNLVLSISLVALLAVALFALVIGRVVAGQIEDQSLDRARETAGIVARSSFAPRIPNAGQRLSKEDRADLDRQVAAAR